MPSLATSATSMLRMADEMARNATALRQLANTLGSAPEPLGHHILALASALDRYGVCLIARDALVTLKGFVESWDADESDHPHDAARRQAALMQAIEQSLHPARWVAKEGGF